MSGKEALDLSQFNINFDQNPDLVIGIMNAVKSDSKVLDKILLAASRVSNAEKNKLLFDYAPKSKEIEDRILQGIATTDDLKLFFSVRRPVIVTTQREDPKDDDSILKTAQLFNSQRSSGEGYNPGDLLVQEKQVQPLIETIEGLLLFNTEAFSSEELKRNGQGVWPWMLKHPVLGSAAYYYIKLKGSGAQIVPVPIQSYMQDAKVTEERYQIFFSGEFDGGKQIEGMKEAGTTTAEVGRKYAVEAGASVTQKDPKEGVATETYHKISVLKVIDTILGNDLSPKKLWQLNKSERDGVVDTYRDLLEARYPDIDIDETFQKALEKKRKSQDRLERYFSDQELMFISEVVDSEILISDQDYQVSLNDKNIEIDSGDLLLGRFLSDQSTVDDDGNISHNFDLSLRFLYPAKHNVREGSNPSAGRTYFQNTSPASFHQEGPEEYLATHLAQNSGINLKYVDAIDLYQPGIDRKIKLKISSKMYPGEEIEKGILPSGEVAKVGEGVYSPLYEIYRDENDNPLLVKDKVVFKAGLVETQKVLHEYFVMDLDGSVTPVADASGLTVERIIGVTDTDEPIFEEVNYLELFELDLSSGGTVVPDSDSNSKYLITFDKNSFVQASTEEGDVLWIKIGDERRPLIQPTYSKVDGSEDLTDLNGRPFYKPRTIGEDEEFRRLKLNAQGETEYSSSPEVMYNQVFASGLSEMYHEALLYMLNSGLINEVDFAQLNSAVQKAIERMNPGGFHEKYDTRWRPFVEAMVNTIPDYEPLDFRKKMNGIVNAALGKEQALLFLSPESFRNAEIMPEINWNPENFSVSSETITSLQHIFNEMSLYELLKIRPETDTDTETDTETEIDAIRKALEEKMKSLKYEDSSSLLDQIMSAITEGSVLLSSGESVVDYLKSIRAVNWNEVPDNFVDLGVYIEENPERTDIVDAYYRRVQIEDSSEYTGLTFWFTPALRQEKFISVFQTQETQEIGYDSLNEVIVNRLESIFQYFNLADNHDYLSDFYVDLTSYEDEESVKKFFTFSDDGSVSGFVGVTDLPPQVSFDAMEIHAKYSDYLEKDVESSKKYKAVHNILRNEAELYKQALIQRRSPIGGRYYNSFESLRILKGFTKHDFNLFAAVDFSDQLMSIDEETYANKPQWQQRGVFAIESLVQENGIKTSALPEVRAAQFDQNKYLNNYLTARLSHDKFGSLMNHIDSPKWSRTVSAVVSDLADAGKAALEEARLKTNIDIKTLDGMTSALSEQALAIAQNHVAIWGKRAVTTTVNTIMNQVLAAFPTRSNAPVLINRDGEIAKVFSDEEEVLLNPGEDFNYSKVPLSYTTYANGLPRNPEQKALMHVLQEFGLAAIANKGEKAVLRRSALKKGLHHLVNQPWYEPVSEQLESLTFDKKMTEVEVEIAYQEAYEKIVSPYTPENHTQNIVDFYDGYIVAYPGVDSGHGVPKMFTTNKSYDETLMYSLAVMMYKIMKPVVENEASGYTVIDEALIAAFPMLLNYDPSKVQKVLTEVREMTNTFIPIKSA